MQKKWAWHKRMQTTIVQRNSKGQELENQAKETNHMHF